MTARIQPGDTVRVTIRSGRLSERGTFETIAFRHPDDARLIVGRWPNGDVILLQRSNGQTVDSAGRTLEVIR